MKNRLVTILSAVYVLTIACAGCYVLNESRSPSEMRQEVEAAKEIKEAEAERENAIADADSTGESWIDWTNMEVIFEGMNCKLPCSYQELAESGWTLDLAKYGYENGYTMSPGDRTYGTMDLENPEYSDKIRVQVGFINNSDTAKNILECDIWSLTVDVNRVVEDGTDCPEFIMANGIAIGSTQDDVDAACGPCENVEDDAEHNYTTYSYQVDYTYCLKFDIHEEYGVTSMSLSTYE